MWQPGWEESLGRMDTQICMCESLCYPPETITTLLISYEVKWSEVTQSCPTLSDPMDCSLPGSSIHGIFQARVLEWVAISFSRGSSPPRDRTRVSRSLTRDQTQAHCIGSAESHPLDYQGSPYSLLLRVPFIRAEMVNSDKYQFVHFFEAAIFFFF